LVFLFSASDQKVCLILFVSSLLISLTPGNTDSIFVMVEDHAGKLGRKTRQLLFKTILSSWPCCYKGRFNEELGEEDKAV
jgi:hypothetical protein